MVRSISLVLVLLLGGAACASSRPSGPAWPKTAEPETDGGESLAPKQRTVAAVEEAEDTPATVESTDVVKPATPAVSEAKAAEPSSSAAEATEETDEVIITTEEIVIEIED